MAHLLVLTVENMEDTDNVEARTTDHHYPWLELETLLANRGHREHIHTHGDKLETRYPHKLPDNKSKSSADNSISNWIKGAAECGKR